MNYYYMMMDEDIKITQNSERSMFESKPFLNLFLQKPVYNVLAITIHISRILRYVASTVLIKENFFKINFDDQQFFFIINPSIHYHRI